jgi:hypothetical protein
MIHRDLTHSDQHTRRHKPQDLDRDFGIRNSCVQLTRAQCQGLLPSRGWNNQFYPTQKAIPTLLLRRRAGALLTHRDQSEIRNYYHPLIITVFYHIWIPVFKNYHNLTPSYSTAIKLLPLHNAFEQYIWSCWTLLRCGKSSISFVSAAIGNSIQDCPPCQYFW